MPIADKDGRDLLVAMLKYTFLVGPSGSVVLDEKSPSEVDLADTYNSKETATASIRRPSQLFEAKPGTDVVMIGHAHPPPRQSPTFVDVSLRVGPIAKTVRAHGFRVWQAGMMGGIAPGPAQSIREPVPLTYELAWGGMDMSDPKKPIGEPRNYSGRGIASDPKTLVHQPAALLEDPAQPIRSGGKNVPASFGAIHRHWQPRASFAGTYDDAWMESRMPLLPADFDNRFHVCVPPDQWSPVPLRGDEPFDISGATPEGSWRFKLPRIAPGFSSVVSGVRREHPTHLDTILVDADERRVELTWRANLAMPKKHEMLERLLIFEKSVL